MRPLNLSNLPRKRFNNKPNTPVKIFMMEGDDFMSAERGNPYEIDLYQSIQDAIELGIINIDGSETKVSAGTNVVITGDGTITSPYVINSTATGGTTSNWFTTIDNITLFATANPTTWITEVNPQEYTIVVPANQRLERIAYLSEVGVNRNSTTNQTIFNINTSAIANTNTTLLNTFTPTLSMNTSTGNVVPVGIGGSPSVSVSAPSGGIRTITIQGNTNITEGQSRIQINDLTV